jgi:hypothetical protein
MFKNILKPRMRLAENVSYQLRDKNGNLKQLFKLNSLGKAVKAMGVAVPAIAVFGSFVDKLTVSNLVTNAGFAGVASRLNGAGSEAVFNYIGIGTGTTAAAVTDTGLEAEIATGGGQRALATASRVTTDVTNDTAQNVVTFNFSSSFAITESGVFNAASAGTLLARQVFSAINVSNGDSLQVTWKFDID